MTVISLTTNFGFGNNEIGILIGELLLRAPGVKIADLTHDLSNNDILDAAVILNRHSSYFPGGSVHLFLNVSENEKPARPIAAKIGEQFFIGPDNGFLTLLIQESKLKNLPMKFIQINHSEFCWEKAHPIFEYRDYFASVTGSLAAGLDFDKLGVEINSPVLINIPSPVRIKNGWKGVILRVDHFGNLESNIHVRFLKGMEITKIQCCFHIFNSLVQTFGDASPGDLVAMIDSSGVVSICQVNGSAARKLNCGVGQQIDVLCDTDCLVD
jgi:hypothetical protein